MKKILWWEPLLDSSDSRAASKAIKMNYPNEGLFTKKLEKKLSHLLKVKHCICVTSGTMAIFLSLKSLNIKKGDEVIVPDITFAATANAVNLCGAKTVLADVYNDSLTIDVDSLEKKINSKTKAVIPVHVSGRGAEMNKILKVARKHKIHVVEDTAEAFMSKHKKKYLGTFGILGCFSFSANKIITSGQGGFIATNNSKINATIRKLKNQGIIGKSDGGNTIHHQYGYNFKYTNLQAAIVLNQLKSLNKRILRLKKHYKIYRDNLNNLEKVKVFKFNIMDGEFPLWTDIWCENRDKLHSYLIKRKIDCRKFWYPLHTQKPFKCSSRNFKNAIKLYKNLLWLPSSLKLSNVDILRVCKSVKNFYEQ